MKNGLVLVTGATGYIGGRLAPELIEAGYRVRVLVRDRNRWSDALVNSQGDLIPVALSTQEGMIIERRRRRIASWAARS